MEAMRCISPTVRGGLQDRGGRGEQAVHKKTLHISSSARVGAQVNSIRSNADSSYFHTLIKSPSLTFLNISDKVATIGATGGGKAFGQLFCCAVCAHSQGPRRKRRRTLISVIGRSPPITQFLLALRIAESYPIPNETVTIGV